jgi:hypothetical protein
MEGKRNAYNVLKGKPEAKRLMERSRHRRKDNIKIHLKDTGLEGSALDSPGLG